jgi:RNA recognition motif-containing protein
LPARGWSAFGGESIENLFKKRFSKQFMPTTLFVGGISYSSSDQSLADHFASAGTVVSAKIITDRFTGKSRGFGFVEMSSDAEAKAAISSLDGSELDGRKLVVKEAQPKAK